MWWNTHIRKELVQGAHIFRYLISGDKTSIGKLMRRYYYILMSVSGSSFTKPPLERNPLNKEQFLSLGKITLNLNFKKIPYQRSSLSKNYLTFLGEYFLKFKVGFLLL